MTEPPHERPGGEPIQPTVEALLDEAPQTAADFAALDAAEGMAVEPITQWALFKARFTRHRLAMFAAGVLFVLISLAIFAPLVPGLKDPVQPLIDENGRALNLLAPRSEFWFGTDQLGQDMLARVIYGGRTSLQVAGLTGLMVASIGTAIGAIAGYYGGWTDNMLMRFTDLVLSLPLLPVAIVAAAWLRETFEGKEALSLAILLGTLLWGTLARIVRAEFLSLREKEFVEAARAAGARDRRIIFRHILPNAISPIIVNATLVIGAAIILEAALSFLGFGVRPPTPAWGQMAAEGGRLAVGGSGAWWMVVFPSVALIVTVLSVNFLGDGLRDALDPTQTIERK
jgi:peptide/nickel transport system permease protein